MTGQLQTGYEEFQIPPENAGLGVGFRMQRNYHGRQYERLYLFSDTYLVRVKC